MATPPSWVKALKPSGPQGHELLEAERAQSNLPVDKLSDLLFTREVIERKRKVLVVLRSEKVFDKSQNHFAGRIQRFETALARAKRLRNIRVKHNWTLEEFRMAHELISEPGPYGLHESMFLVTLNEQGTPEQKERFLTKAENYEIIGCYAQTELGHGSNVRGLETTATWNHADKTFTIHSPHLTASKWWIGSLGRTANHAVVMAQLIIDGKSYGPHPFVVQIRDMKTHQPLENVHVGDIGPKFGYNTMDNGFLLFNNIKVPYISMLARFSKVDPRSGKYVRQGSQALVYGTLTWVRSTIVMQAGSVLARGVTIASRYVAVRRQFADRDATEDAVETPVLNYTMVQARLLPLLATTFALHFTGKAMMDLYSANQKKVEESGVGSNGDLLADLHASSCGLKALSSTLAAEGLEVCRRACGGHGYSAFSGIGSWYADYLPTVTWEGDNYMLTQQVARYLLKSARHALSAKKPINDTTQILSHYLSRPSTGAAFDVINSDADLVGAFAWRAAHLTFSAYRLREEQKKPWNDLLIDFYRLNKAYAQYLLVKNFFETLSTPATTSSINSSTLEVLRSLFQLFALNTLEQESSEFISSGACTAHQVALIRDVQLLKLLKEVRPHTIKLVDSWDFSDFILDSSLGRYDGKVYEDMFYRASELNPLNKVTVDPYPNSEVLFREDRSAELSVRSKL